MGETVGLGDLVQLQATDDGLWFDALTALEAYLQQELRRLHASVEASLAEARELDTHHYANGIRHLNDNPDECHYFVHELVKE